MNAINAEDEIINYDEVLTGVKLPDNEIPTLTYVENIYYYDGPLLDVFMDSNKVPVLRSWVDCTDTYNVWAFIWVTHDAFNQYLNSQKSMASIFRESSNILVVNTDHDGHDFNLRMVTAETLMQSHAPTEDSYLSLPKVHILNILESFGYSELNDTNNLTP